MQGILLSSFKKTEKLLTIQWKHYLHYDDLIVSAYYTLIDEDDPRIEMFWSAVKNFSNDDRSHLLKFITGRRRLPVSIFITAGKK